MEQMTIRRLEPDDWELERSLRLAALADSPSAFGSTLAEARKFVEQDWRARVASQTRFAATHGPEPIGTAGASPAKPPYPAGEVLLVGMWVSPAARGTGVGDHLVAGVLGWAVDAGWNRVRLAVTPGNAPALRLYRRHGFVDIPDAERIEADMIEMIWTIDNVRV